MEFITTILNFVKWAVIFAGAVIGVLGGMKYGDGHGHDNPGLKDTGGKMIVGGIIIIAVGAVLVPQLLALATPPGGGANSGGGGTPQGLLRVLQTYGLMR